MSEYCSLNFMYIKSQWQIQDFPEEGRQPSGGGRQDTISIKFLENSKSLVGGGVHCAPLRSATEPKQFLLFLFVRFDIFVSLKPRIYETLYKIVHA